VLISRLPGPEDYVLLSGSEDEYQVTELYIVSVNQLNNIHNSFDIYLPNKDLLHGLYWNWISN
jgi:hypothetical protein